MNIALVFPASTFLIDPMVYPPLGLWYLGARLESLGHHCDFYDLAVDELPQDGDYDQLWLSATSAQMHEVRKIGNETYWWHKTKTVFGGSAPWAGLGRYEDWRELGFGLIVAGESDHPRETQKILVMAEEAHPITNPMTYQTQITPGPLDWVLPPLRRWSDKYHATLQGHRTTTLFTSRGCPMACAFCESGRNGVIWDRFVRYEPLEVVEQQVRESVELGHTGLMFYDDILPLNKPRTLALMEILKKYNVVWRCFLRTDVIAKQGGIEYLRQMRDAGLVEVLAGVESADNRIKDNIHKGTTIEQDTQALQWCKELGILFKASLILGLPGEDWQSMERTREWVLTNRPDRVDVNTLVPFPGTPITMRADDYDVFWTERIPEEFWYKGPRDRTQAIVGTSNLDPDEIRRFHDGLIREIEEAGIPY